MESKRLSKHQTLVVQLLCGGLFSAFLGLGLASLYGRNADAADTLPGTASVAAPAAGSLTDHQFDIVCKDPNSQTCKNFMGKADPCPTAIDKITGFSETLGNACKGRSLSECKDKINTCQGDDDSVTADDLDGDGSTPTNPCAQIKDINIGCKEANGGNSRDYRQAKTDAQNSLNDAQTKLLDAQKKQQSDQDKIKEQITKLQTEIQQLQLALEDKGKQVKEALADLLAADQSEAAKNATAALAKLAEYDAADRQLTTERNNAVSAIAAASDAKLAKCRDYAETAYNKDLEALKIKIQARDSVVRNLGSATTIAAYTTNKAKQDENDKSKSYAGHYNNCMNNIEGGGSDASAAIAQKQRELTVLDEDQKAKRANLVTQRALINKQLSDATAAMAAKEKNANQKAIDDLDSATKATTLKVNADNTQITTLTTQLANSQSTNSQELSMLQQNLQNAMADSQNASLRSTCFDQFGVSESKAKRAEDNWSKVPSALNGIKSYCAQLDTYQCGVAKPDDCSTYGSTTARGQNRTNRGNGTAQ